jgi:hypothetical protein
MVASCGVLATGSRLIEQLRLVNTHLLGEKLSRQLFVDGTPEVSEAGGGLVGKSRQERFDRT